MHAAKKFGEYGLSRSDMVHSYVHSIVMIARVLCTNSDDGVSLMKNIFKLGAVSLAVSALPFLFAGGMAEANELDVGGGGSPRGNNSI